MGRVLMKTQFISASAPASMRARLESQQDLLHARQQHQALARLRPVLLKVGQHRGLQVLHLRHCLHKMARQSAHEVVAGGQ